MTHRLFLPLILLAAALLAGACTPAATPAAAVPLPPSPAGATATPSLPPTDTPAPQVPWITAENASSLVVSSEVDLPYCYRLFWSSDGATLAAFADNALVLFNGQTLRQLGRMPAGGENSLLDYSPATGLAAVSADQQNIDLLRASTGELVQRIEPASPFTNVSFSPDGSLLAVTSIYEWEVSLWETGSGSLRQTLRGFETAAPVYGASFAGPKYILYVARATAQMQDITTGEMLPGIYHEEFIGGIDYSPDLDLLATAAAGTYEGTYSGLVTLWEPKTGEPRSIFRSDERVSNALSFSPGGSLLAGTAGEDILVWDVAGNVLAASFPAHTEMVSNLSFSPDGRSLASSGVVDGKLRLWQVSACPTCVNDRPSM